MDKRLNGIDQRLDKVEEKLNGAIDLINSNTKELIDLTLSRFKYHDSQLVDHEHRITSLESTHTRAN